LDLQKGYFQVPVAAADVQKTAVITPFGLFEFVKMPFGLKNAGMTFQRLMYRILFDIPYVFVYLDDMLIASRNKEEHLLHLREVLGRLQDNGLVLNVAKCIWGQAEVEFLGHLVSAAGVAPLPDRVVALQAFPQPVTIQQLQAFLGLFNFYCRFVPAAAAVVCPLTDALRGGRKGSAVVEWTPPMLQAFAAAKAALAAATLLDHPALGADILVVTDASSTHVGAVLQQRRSGSAWRPLGFFSRKLSTAESHYSAFDRELLAVYSSLLHFRHMLEGRRFTVFTDHKPLVGALTRVSEPKSDRQRRQLSAIAELTADIRHIAGPTNVVADTLSRPPPSVSCSVALESTAASPAGSSEAPESAAAAGGWSFGGGSAFWSYAEVVRGGQLAQASAVTTRAAAAAAAARPCSAAPLDISQIAEAQRDCPDCQRAPDSAALRVVRVQMGGQQVLVDTLSGVIQPLVPPPLRRQIFAAVHRLAHPGIRATRCLVASRYLWPGLAKDIAALCRDCQACQRAKVTKQATAAVQPIPVPTVRVTHVHVDLVGRCPHQPRGISKFFRASTGQHGGRKHTR
jgi:RNase H-like domain found in reverse transcriptase/Reverse transcriptase (RNA-dependent DNA polymerase)/Integrase zinc binding domain